VGVDVGTTGVKACVLSLAGKPTVHQCVYPFPLLVPHPGWAEQDPDLVFQTVISCVHDVLVKAALMPRQIAAISLGSALHSLMAADGEGRPLSNNITWADNRSARQAQRLRNRATGPMLYRRTGLPLHAMSPLAKIMWFHDQRREIFHKAAKFISIKEYILHKLCGSCLVDYCTASGSGLFNLADLRWDDEALGLAGIQASQLSSPAPATSIIRGIQPDFAHAMGLSPDVPVVLGASDAILSHLGVGAFDAPSCSLTIGTSSGLRAFASAPVVDAVSGGTFCYAFTENRWLVGCPCSTGGIALRWFNETFPGNSMRGAGSMSANSLEPAIESALKLPIGADGLLFLPFITGERAPGRNPDARGVFFGVGLHHRREHFVRAVIEGIILSVHSLYVPLQRLGVNPEESRVSGGFAGMPEVRQVMADVFGHDVLVPHVSEACSYGAALLAMHALGVLPELSDIPKQVQIGDRRRPDQVRHRAYNGLGDLFENVYRNLQESFTALGNSRELQINMENEESS
jgi:gluconokinase